MKRFFHILLTLLLCFQIFHPAAVMAAQAETESETAAPAPAVAVNLDTDKVTTQDIALFSSACCVMNADTGEILYAKNMDDRHYPASITKVLTSLLLIENAKLTDMITYTSACWDGVVYSRGDMNIGMLDGEQLSVEASLHAMLLASANEVCNGVAAHTAGSVSAFCDMMNARAQALGCTNSHFTNPNGLQNKDHYTSAHDMALISREAIKNPTFRRITGTPSYMVEKTNMREDGFPLNHKHRMLLQTSFHYDACIGGKTGYTTDAGNTLVTFAEKNGLTLVCVVMENRDGHIYPDTITALDYCFDHYTVADAPAAAPASVISTALPFAGLSSDAFHITGSSRAFVVLPAGDDGSTLSTNFTADGSAGFMAPYTTPVSPLGTISYLTADAQLSGTRPLFYSDAAFTLADFSRAQEDAAKVLAEENETSEPETRRGEQTFIHLREAEEISEEEASGPSALWPPRILLDFAENYILAYPLQSFLILAMTFLIATFLLIWLHGVHIRAKHRRRYRRLRKARLSESEKNNG